MAKSPKPPARLLPATVILRSEGIRNIGSTKHTAVGCAVMGNCVPDALFHESGQTVAVEVQPLKKVSEVLAQLMAMDRQTPVRDVFGRPVRQAAQRHHQRLHRKS